MAVVMKPTPIEDPDDPRVAVFRDLRDRNLRDRRGLFIAESTRVVERLLDHWPETVDRVLIERHRLRGLKPMIQRLAAEHRDRINWLTAEAPLVEAVAGYPITRGVLAAGVRPGPEMRSACRVLEPLADRQRLTLVALDGVADLDNLGCIVRHAAGLGADALLLSPACGDPLYRKAIRVSMGHVFSVPWIRDDDDWPSGLEADLQWLERTKTIDSAAAGRLERIAVEVTPDATPLWQAPFAERCVFIFGSEASGISRRTLARCDRVVQIPMRPDVPSLNVATAVSLVLYERLRQTLMRDAERSVSHAAESAGQSTSQRPCS